MSVSKEWLNSMLVYRFSISAAAVIVALAFAPGAVAQQAQPNQPAAAAISAGPTPPEVMSRDAQGKPMVRAVRIQQPLKIDGRLDEEIYQQIPAISDFVQQLPRNGEPATERTEVWVFFDGKNLYVAARCLDTHPERMIINEVRRDGPNIPQNENFTFVIDTFHDQRNGFWFQTNPASALRDQVIIDESQNSDWNTVMEVKGTRFEGGWSTEFSIPFKSLRYLGSGPQTWGINFRRMVRWKNEVSTLALIPAAYGLPGLARMATAATLVGLETPAQSMNLELKPYILSTATTDYTTPADRSELSRCSRADANTVLKCNAGFDFKYGLTRSLIADVTYNTDFAQVEEDVQQVNLTRFNLQFREKRDFFLEGPGLFSFGAPEGNVPVLFFSRRIGLSEGQAVPVVAGARLSGKAGPFSIGALNIQTGEKASASALSTNFSVLRIKRDILRRSNVGIIFTRRTPGTEYDGSNLVGGIDTNLLLTDFLTVNGYYARTKTPGRKGDDSSYRARFAYAPDRYGLSVEHLVIGPQFNPEVGFLRREDFRRNFVEARFSPRPNGKRIRRLSWQASLEHITSADRAVVQDRETDASFDMEFQSGDRWSLEFSKNYELLPENFTISRGVIVPQGAYNYQTVETSYFLGQQHRVSGTLSLSRGTLYGGTKTEATYSGRTSLTRQFALEPSVTLNWVDLPFGDFRTTLITNRFVFMPTPQLLASSLVQFNASRHSLTSSVRLRWEYAPRSELFIVYTDGRDRTLSGQPEILSRSLAVKVTRLLRF